MLRWSCIIAVIVIAVLCAIELLYEVSPLELITGESESSENVIRIGVAAWQMLEFPWEEAIRRYEEEIPDGLRFSISILLEDSFNTLLLSWRRGYTDYDCVVAFADEEIHPFIRYNEDAADPKDRSLLLNVRDYLSAEQIDQIVPACWPGNSKLAYPDKPDSLMSYEIPWMGEVMCLNYNRKFFSKVGLDPDKPPTTWDEVEAACRKLKGLKNKNKDGEEFDVAPLGMYFAQRQKWFIQNCYLGLLAEKLGRVLDDEGRVELNGPEPAEVLRTLKRWYKEGYITDISFSGQAIEQALVVERTAMYCHWQSRGLWAVAELGEDIIGIAPTPGAKRAGSLMSTYGCIFPNSLKNKKKIVQACYEVFCTDKYGFQSGVSKGFIRKGKKVGGGKMPAAKSIYDDPELPAGIANLRSGLDSGYAMPDPANMRQCTGIFVVEFQKYVRETPKRTAEETLEIVRKRFVEEVYASE